MNLPNPLKPTFQNQIELLHHARKQSRPWHPHSASARIRHGPHIEFTLGGGIFWLATLAALFWFSSRSIFPLGHSRWTTGESLSPLGQVHFAHDIWPASHLPAPRGNCVRLGGPTLSRVARQTRYTRLFGANRTSAETVMCRKKKGTDRARVWAKDLMKEAAS